LTDPKKGETAYFCCIMLMIIDRSLSTHESFEFKLNPMNKVT